MKLSTNGPTARTRRHRKASAKRVGKALVVPHSNRALPAAAAKPSVEATTDTSKKTPK